VQLILLLEALNGFLFSSDYLKINLNSSILLETLICFTIPALVWSLLKRPLTLAAQVLPLRRQLNLFKYDESLFQQSLSKQARFAVGKDLMPIILGNYDAEMIITIVSNPYCSPCAIAHLSLDELLKKRKDLQLRIVFISANEDDDARTKVARHIIALNMFKDTEIVKAALNDWYFQITKYEDWIEKFPVEYNEEVAEATSRQKDWCEMAEIDYTPAILINGYKLPDPYRVEDLEFLIN